MKMSQRKNSLKNLKGEKRLGCYQFVSQKSSYSFNHCITDTAQDASCS